MSGITNAFPCLSRLRLESATIRTAAPWVATCGAAALLAGCTAPCERPARSAWPRGHLTSVSASYAAIDEAAAVSWPANHDAQVSRRWPHPPAHLEQSSRAWPPAHIAAASATWPPTHDPAVSRAWWPGHTSGDSRTFVSPPVHATEASTAWTHSSADSRHHWPPNHTPSASSGWPRDHAVGVSISFPPGHLLAASSTWRGPSPTWPPSHSSDVSMQWLFPEDHNIAQSTQRTRQLPAAPWPVFPASHAWLASYSTLLPRQNATDPWNGSR